MAGPGWLVSVRRRSTLRSFLAGPLTWVLSWRIRQATQGRFNHSGILVGDARYLVEAQWAGVLHTPLESYTSKPWKYEVDLLPPPAGVDGLEAGHYALQQVGKGRYDWRMIVLLKTASVLFGVKGLRMILAREDDAWECAELVATAFGHGGWKPEDGAPIDPSGLREAVRASRETK